MHWQKNIHPHRLKQTDYDGKFEYSSIIAIEKKSANYSNNSTIYPNPAKNQIEVLLGAKIQYPSVVRIFDVKGQLVYQNAPEDFSGKFKINVSSFNPGLYLITFTGNNTISKGSQKIYKSKFIKN